MIRAVLDTNVVVSALLFRGVASALVPAWQHQRMLLLVSNTLLKEYIRVLHYPKFRLTTGQIRHLVQEELLPFITPVRVTRVPRVVRDDPADNHVLACAVSGKADLIVTGDRHLLALGSYRHIPLVEIPALLARLRVHL